MSDLIMMQLVTRKRNETDRPEEEDGGDVNNTTTHFIFVSKKWIL